MKIKSALKVSYDLVSSSGILSYDNLNLIEHGKGKRRLIVIDRGICEFYLKNVEHYFAHHGFEIQICIIDAVENNKNLESLLTVLNSMESFGLVRRDEPVIAIGGGTLLDIVGMAAGMYRRGVPYIRVPTTLVGLIDASVGIKTGINFGERRNRLGSYYPPLVSYLDVYFLKTLPTMEIVSGLGEILKIAVIKDCELFILLELYSEELIATQFQNIISNLIINRSINGMATELEQNLWETNLKRAVDFGHSFSPIIEMRSLKTDYPLMHGQAVALDILFSCVFSHGRDLLSKNDLDRVYGVMKKIGLPTSHPLFNDPLIILEALTDTIRHRNGDQNLPIPTKIGEHIFINDISYDEIKDVVDVMRIL